MDVSQLLEFMGFHIFIDQVVLLSLNTAYDVFMFFAF
jgi:hypothetical protein